MVIQGTRIFGVLFAGILLASCDAFKDADIIMPAVVSVVPADSSAISGATPLVLSFNRSMDTRSLEVSGTLASEVDTPVWSETASRDDTVTLSPVNTWPDGAQTLIIDANDVPGYELETVTLNYNVDGTLPVASLNPAAGMDLLDDQVIEISFSESMNPDSLTGSGSLWEESTAPASHLWSTVANANDRLTISPDSSWTLGPQTLVMDVNDMAGNAIVTIDVSYNAITSIIVNCNEDNDEECELRLGEVCLRDAQCYAGICKRNQCSLSRNQCTDFLDRPLPQGTPCDDGDPDTVNDQCNGTSMCIGIRP